MCAFAIPPDVNNVAIAEQQTIINHTFPLRARFHITHLPQAHTVFFLPRFRLHSGCDRRCEALAWNLCSRCKLRLDSRRWIDGNWYTQHPGDCNTISGQITLSIKPPADTMTEEGWGDGGADILRPSNSQEFDCKSLKKRAYHSVTPR